MSNLRSCPVCLSSADESYVFQEENIDQSKISEFSFASRKLPEFMCHRLLSCRSCDLVYASNPPDQSELANSYHVSDYDSSEEANDAAKAYIKAMKPILKVLRTRETVLEIGSGTGVLLELLKNEGFTGLIGIEPSSAAILAAPKYRQKWLQKGIFEEQNYESNSFDLICCFMTMEHVHDPAVVAKAAYNLLRPGGIFVTVTHNYRSLVNIILGKRSPIIDIEHMQLFSKISIQHLFSISGYTDISVKAFKNTYSLRYWFRLAPFPRSIKSMILPLLNKSGIGNLRVGINVGNLIAFGKKGK
jgi:SAM-dependent methyltransferase